MLEDLQKAAEPLIKYLAENHHPHTTAVVTNTGVEIVEGVMNIQGIDKFLKD